MSAPQLIVNLHSAPSRIDEVMAGPWRDITIDTVHSSATILRSEDEEHAGFVLSGVLEITSASGERFTLRKGGAFAIPHGGEIELRSAATATFLHIVLRIGRADASHAAQGIGA